MQNSRQSHIGNCVSIKLNGEITVKANCKSKLKKKHSHKRNALVVSRSGQQFWTTQKQFWEWVRNGLVAKTRDAPLTGAFVREHEESFVVRQNTVLNTAHRNHFTEALASRKTWTSTGK